MTADEIRARWAAATPGPWAWDSRGDKCVDVQIGIAVGPQGEQLSGFVPENAVVVYIEPIADLSLNANAFADAEFCAHAWQDIRYLLDENKRLRVALEPFRIRAEEVQHRGDGSIVLIHTTAGELKEVLRALIAPQPDDAIPTQSERNSDAIAAEKE